MGDPARKRGYESDLTLGQAWLSLVSMNPERTAVARIPAELEFLKPLTPELLELLPLVPDAERAGRDYLRPGMVVA